MQVQVLYRDPGYCVTAVDPLNRETNEEGYVLGMQSWTSSRVQRWNLFYKCLTSKEAMRAFLKMPQEFQDDMVGNIDWTPPEMDDILAGQRRDGGSSGWNQR